MAGDRRRLHAEIPEQIGCETAGRPGFVVDRRFGFCRVVGFRVWLVFWFTHCRSLFAHAHEREVASPETYLPCDGKCDNEERELEPDRNRPLNRGPRNRGDIGMNLPNCKKQAHPGVATLIHAMYDPLARLDTGIILTSMQALVRTSNAASRSKAELFQALTRSPQPLDFNALERITVSVSVSAWGAIEGDGMKHAENSPHS